MRKFLHVFSMLIMTAAVIFVLGGCAAKEKQSAPKKPAKTVEKPASASETPAQESMTNKFYYIHMVQWPGETLSIIAKWYTGEIDKWKALAKSNPKLDPNRIFIGDKIYIPKYLMKTRQPMPQDFVATFLPETEKTVETPAPAPPAPSPPEVVTSPGPAPPSPIIEEEEEPVLFGPR